MTAGGSTADCDEVRIPAVGRDVLLDPRQRAFDVDDVVGPGVQRGDAVVHRHAHPTARNQVAHQGIRLGAAPPDHPRAAGHLQQHRRLAVTRQVAAAPDVGQIRPPVRAVGHDVLLVDEAPPGHGGAQRQVASTPAGGLRRQRFQFPGVIRAELFGQPGFQHRTRSGGTAVADHSQDRPGCRGKGKRRFAFRAGEIAAAAAAQGVQRGGGGVQARHL